MALEDFTTYTKVDPNGRFTITAPKIAVSGLPQSEDAYVYDDKGANHFGATWEHEWETYCDDLEYQGYGASWGVANVIEDARYWVVNTSQALYVFYYSSDEDTYLKDAETGHQDGPADTEHNLRYYHTCERTSETSVEVRIYTDAARTALLDTLCVTITDGRRYRYAFGANSYNTGAAKAVTYDVENLDLNEGGAPPAGNPHYYYQLLRKRRSS